MICLETQRKKKIFEMKSRGIYPEYCHNVCILGSDVAHTLLAKIIINWPHENTFIESQRKCHATSCLKS